jgi:ubiquinone biosynthesis O-methyltransferase
MKIQEYYDLREELSFEYFEWKTTRYKANKSISKSFEWINFDRANVLDIGCGVGYYAIPLAHKCKHITGIDISEHNIKLAKEYAQELSITNTTFEARDIFDFRPSVLFDVVYMITVLMHIEDIDRAFKTIRSFLKPGGVLLISDLNKWFSPRILLIKNSLPIFNQTFTFHQLRDKLHKNGFDIINESGRLYSLGGLRKPDWVIMSWMEKFARFVPFKYLGEHIAVLAKRSISEEYGNDQS